MPIRIIVVSFERMVCPLHYVRSGSLAETRPHTTQAATKLHLHERISLTRRLGHFLSREAERTHECRVVQHSKIARRRQTRSIGIAQTKPAGDHEPQPFTLPIRSRET